MKIKIKLTDERLLNLLLALDINNYYFEISTDKLSSFIPPGWSVYLILGAINFGKRISGDSIIIKKNIIPLKNFVNNYKIETYKEYAQTMYYSSDERFIENFYDANKRHEKNFKINQYYGYVSLKTAFDTDKCLITGLKQLKKFYELWSALHVNNLLYIPATDDMGSDKLHQAERDEIQALNEQYDIHKANEDFNQEMNDETDGGWGLERN